MDQALLDKIRALVLPLFATDQVELVDLFLSRQRARTLLRFLVDKSGGITLHECALLNQKISELLDRENIIQESYILEVSSPGLDRSLVETKDFQRSLGKLAKIVLRKAINGQNVCRGFIETVQEDILTIRSEAGEKIDILRKDIARANLEVQL